MSGLLHMTWALVYSTYCMSGLLHMTWALVYSTYHYQKTECSRLVESMAESLTRAVIHDFEINMHLHSKSLI